MKFTKTQFFAVGLFLIFLVSLSVSVFLAQKRQDIRPKAEESTESSITATSIPAGCYYQQVKCIQAPCEPILVCPTTILGPTCTPRPDCVDGIKRPDGTIQYCALDLLPGGWLCPKNTPTPHPGCYLKKSGDTNCDGVIDGLDYSGWLNSQCNPGPSQKCAKLDADFDGDGKVDDSDYKTWFNNRGK